MTTITALHCLLSTDCTAPVAAVLGTLGLPWITTSKLVKITQPNLSKVDSFMVAL